MNLHSYRLKFTKKALALLLTTLLLVNNAYAFKWTPTAVEYVKKGVEVTVKSNAGKTATKVLTAGSKSVVNKAPSSLLVQSLIYLGFEAVDYVLDPANNSVRVVNDTGNCRVTHAGGGGDWNNKEFGSVQEVYDAVLKGRNKDYWVIQNKHVDKQSKTFSFELRDINPNSSGGRWQYSGTCMPTETQVSYDDVANAIDELAKQGDKTAQETLKTAVADEIADGLHDNALDVDVAEVDKAIDDLTSVKDKYKTKDKAKEQEKADEKTKEKEQGKDKPFELPDFCTWANFICDDELVQDKKDVDIDELAIPTNTVNVRFQASCPPDIIIPVSFANINTQFAMTYSYICKLASSVAILVQICSSIFALYILTGIRS